MSLHCLILWNQVDIHQDHLRGDHAHVRLWMKLYGISFLSLTAGPPHVVKNEFGEECIQVEQNISHPPGMSNGGLQNIQHPAVVGHPPPHGGPPHGGPPHGGPPRGGPGPSTAGLNEFNRMMAHQQGESTSHQRFQPVQK